MTFLFCLHENFYIIMFIKYYVLIRIFPHEKINMRKSIIAGYKNEIVLYLGENINKAYTKYILIFWSDLDKTLHKSKNR